MKERITSGPVAGKPAKFTVLLDLREVRYGKVMVAILAIPPMFLAGFLIWPVSLGWALGSGTILCLAASGWVSLGSLLVYFGSTYRVPVFAALFSLAVVSSCWRASSREAPRIRRVAGSITMRLEPQHLHEYHRRCIRR